MSANERLVRACAGFFCYCMYPLSIAALTSVFDRELAVTLALPLTLGGAALLWYITVAVLASLKSPETGARAVKCAKQI